MIENAVKYREPERPLRLTITGERDGSQCAYRFMDNGVGITPGNGEKIFEFFHRVNPGRGSGLGLTVVRRAVERMRGSIRVARLLLPGGNSQPGHSEPHGSRFCYPICRNAGKCLR